MPYVEGRLRVECTRCHKGKNIPMPDGLRRPWVGFDNYGHSNVMGGGGDYGGIGGDIGGPG